MFDDVTKKIISRLQNIGIMDLKKTRKIIEEEITPLQILADKKTEVIEFKEKDFHLLQFPLGTKSLSSIENALTRLSTEINSGLDCKRNFIFAYGDEKINIEVLDKTKVYIFKVPMGSMDKCQCKHTMDEYNDKIAKEINKHGYNITFLPDELVLTPAD